MRYNEIMFEASPTGKIIAYHGTGRKIEQFSDPHLAGHFFTQDKEYAKNYSGGKTSLSLIDKPKKTRNYLLTVELDIRHMFDTKTDPKAVEYYNTQFLPRINALNAKYNKQPRPVQAPGKYVSFVEADDLFRYFMSFKSDYDGMLVDEGGISAYPAIVAFYGSQIKIVKREIIKFDNPS